MGGILPESSGKVQDGCLPAAKYRPLDALCGLEDVGKHGRCPRGGARREEIWKKNLTTGLPVYRLKYRAVCRGEEPMEI